MSLTANLQAETNESGNILSDFSHFLQESNIIDTAVGIIIGNAFKGIVDSFVADVMTPMLSHLAGQTGTKFEDLYYVIGTKSAKDYKDIDQAIKAGANVIRYGKFIQGILRFLMQALVVFMLIRMWTNVKKLRHVFPTQFLLQ
jgi:large conductance mechanosensitive channel